MWATAFRKLIANIKLLLNVLTFKEKLVIFIILLFNIFTRFVWGNNLGFYFDTVTTQFNWSDYAYKNGLFSFWGNYYGFFDYTPAALVYLYFVRLLSSWFYFIPGNEVYDFVFTLKFLNTIWDFLIGGLLGFMLYKCKILDLKKAIYSFLIILWLPGLMFISNVWGQFDSLVFLLNFLSLVLFNKFLQRYRSHTDSITNINYEKSIRWHYFFELIGISNFNGNKIELSRPLFLSAFLWCLALAVKPISILFLPAFIALIIKNLNLKRLELFTVLKEALSKFFIILVFFLVFYLFSIWIFHNAENYQTSITFLFIVLLLVIFYLILRLKSFYLRVWSLGFLLSFVIFNFYACVSDIIRVHNNFLNIASRLDVATQGAANLWLLLGILDSNTTLFNVWSLGLSVKLISTFLVFIIFVDLFIGYVWGNKLYVYVLKKLMNNGNQDKISVCNLRKVLSLRSRNLRILKKFTIKFFEESAKFIDKKQDFKKDMLFLGAFLFFFFVLSVGMHSRYAIYGVLFLTFYLTSHILSLEDIKFLFRRKDFLGYLIILVLLNIAFLFNQLIVYRVSGYNDYLGGVLLLNLSNDIVDSIEKSISFLYVFIFIVIYILIIRTILPKNIKKVQSV